MAIFGTELPAKRLARYPHMFPLDIAIWERFIDEYGEEYSSFWYDTKVGSGVEPAKDIGQNYEKMVRELSKYRIDVVGTKAGAYEVFEVKPNASASALGQIITYTTLLAQEHPEFGVLRGALVTDRELPDMRMLTSQMGINYYVV